MADPSTTAFSLFSINALLKRYVRNVPPTKTAIVGPVANVPLPVSFTKSMFAQNSPNPLMSVMAVLIETNAPWRNICTKLLLHKKSMNWSEANPDLALLFQKVNSNRWMTLFPLF